MSSILVVPSLDEKPWPSLGGQVCDFIEENLTFGPGDLLGQPARLDDEKRGLIYRAYEVYPKGHDRAGRRRFKRVAWSLRKGSAKTELAAWIAICELHPQAPVRCIGFDRKGHPIGGPVTDPFIPMVAFTEEQSEDLAYGAMLAILQQEECAVGQDFDIGLARILVVDRSGKAAGKAAPYATAPNSRDGARTTFQHFDETTHMTSDRLKKAHRAMLRNVPKRKIADGWSLETTTAPIPGAGSVAEETMDFARAVADGRVREPQLFFFHRQASEKHDLTTVKGRMAAVREASGPVAKWSDLHSIVKQWDDPTADRSELERTWLNKPTKSSDRAFDVVRWKELARAGYVPAKGALITLGFDGSQTDDATGLIGTEIETGFQWPVGIWERPHGEEGRGWSVPEEEVDAKVAFAFEQWEVWRMYADPPYWETWVNTWAGRYGEARGDGAETRGVIKWLTRWWRKMAEAVRAYANAMRDGSISHSGDPDFARHIGNAHKRLLDMRDEDNKPLWIIQKERPGSPMKIDGAVAGVLSWRARLDALAAGVGPEAPSPYEGPQARGFLSL